MCTCMIVLLEEIFKTKKHLRKISLEKERTRVYFLKYWLMSRRKKSCPKKNTFWINNSMGGKKKKKSNFSPANLILKRWWYVRPAFKLCPVLDQTWLVLDTLWMSLNTSSSTHLPHKALVATWSKDTDLSHTAIEETWNIPPERPLITQANIKEEKLSTKGIICLRWVW